MTGSVFPPCSMLNHTHISTPPPPGGMYDLPSPPPFETISMPNAFHLPPVHAPLPTHHAHLQTHHAHLPALVQEKLYYAPPQIRRAPPVPAPANQIPVSLSPMGPIKTMIGHTHQNGM